MATQPERIVLTYDDYVQLPNDRNRYELFEGEIEVTPAPSTRHQRVVANLLFLLKGHVQARALGTVLVAPCDVLLSDVTVVQPDLLFVAREREAIIEAQYVRGAPDLVIEVVSPSTARTDRQAKRQLYARHGARHYWIFDYDRRDATAYVLDNGAYRQVASAQGHGLFSASPFTDLAISLAEVWA